MSEPSPKSVDTLVTGISGLDLITKGGLPKGRTVVVAGTAGSGKTVLAAQFLATGISTFEQPGVFVACEETPADVRRNLAGFGWDVAAWESAGLWAFVDGSRPAEDSTIQVGAYDLTALLARIEAAVGRIGAKRVAIDSLDALFSQFSNDAVIRNELRRMKGRLQQWGVTTMLTAERTADYGPISRQEVEEFVSDNVILLRNVLNEGQRRRTIEILKVRGADHDKGEFGFSINSHGITVIPHLDIEDVSRLTAERITSGNAELDAMCDGGLFRDSVVLVSGAAGTGKTLLMTLFVTAAIEAGERCLILAYEERREQLLRNARGWGYDFEAMEQQGLLKVLCVYPEVATLDDHLVSIKASMADFKPERVALDSLSALERVATPGGFRKFVVSLSALFKHRNITALLTSTTPTFLGGSSHTESHLSTVTDLIILLRHVEAGGEIRRGLAVLKMRGSKHDNEMRQFTVDSQGMHIGPPFTHTLGIARGPLGTSDVSPARDY